MPLSKALPETSEVIYIQPLSYSFLLLMKMQQKSQCGRMPVTLNIKCAAIKLLSVKEVIRGSKQQWKIVVLVSTLCQVLSETERVSAPTKQMEIIVLHWDKAGFPPRSWPHNYISLPELSLSTTPHAKQLSGRRFDTAAILTIPPYFSCPDMQTQGQLVPRKNKTSLDKQDVRVFWSHSHLFSLWLRKHPQLPADPFTYCTHNASSSCYIHHWASVGAVSMSLRVLMLLTGYINCSFHLQRCSRKGQIHESIHKHYKEIHKFFF